MSVALDEDVKLDTADEVARWLRVSPRTVRSWGRRGYIRRFPGDRYHAVDACEYLEKRSGLNTQRSRRTPAACTS